MRWRQLRKFSKVPERVDLVRVAAVATQAIGLEAKVRVRPQKC